MGKELRLPTIGDVLPTLLAVFDPAMEDRRQRRGDRLRKSARLPPGKIWYNFDRPRLPPPRNARR